MQRAHSPFSANSESYYAQGVTLGSGERLDVFIKSGLGVDHEASLLRILRQHFPHEMLQRQLAYDMPRGKIIYHRFPGRTCSELILDLMNNIDGNERGTFEMLLNAELTKAEAVVSAQLETIRESKDLPDDLEQAIHRFYFDRLHGNTRLRQVYEGMRVPDFLKGEGGKILTLHKFMSMKIIINGTECTSLEEQCRHAEGILDPHGKILGQSSVALGLGDSHGGNVMINSSDSGAPLLIDYEVAGFHNPFLDPAKSLYNDGFFSALYRDLLRTDENTERPVDWQILDSEIHIHFRMQLSLLECALGSVKLEYNLGPLLEHLKKQPTMGQENWDVILGAALFACALLTRDFSAQSEAFFLNCAFAVVLMNELRESLRTLFNWSDESMRSHTRTHEKTHSGTSDSNTQQCSLSQNTSLDVRDIEVTRSMRAMLRHRLETDMVFLKKSREDVGASSVISWFSWAGLGQTTGEYFEGKEGGNAGRFLDHLCRACPRMLRQLHADRSSHLHPREHFCGVADRPSL